MISRRSQMPLLVFSTVAAIIALVIASYSLLNPGVYSPGTPDNLLPGAVSQDLVTVLCSLLLLLCAWLILQGRLLLWMVWLGLLGYLYYAYALYSYERVYNELFLGYLAVMGFSLYAIIGFLMQMDIYKLAVATPNNPPPRKSVAAFFALLVLMFLGLWLSILLPSMKSRIPPVGNAIFVMDLTFVLPLLVWTTTLLVNKRRLGDLLAVVLLVKAGTLGMSVLIGAAIAPLFDLPLSLQSIVVYSLLGVVPLLMIRPYLKRLAIMD